MIERPFSLEKIEAKYL